jgi:hypothetical protein
LSAIRFWLTFLLPLVLCPPRFQQWAFGDGELREIWSALPEQGQSLFPLLRGGSDLMMMPKDLLLDASIREDMCANLDFATMVYMLSRFQADDFASDGIPGQWAGGRGEGGGEEQDTGGFGRGVECTA